MEVNKKDGGALPECTIYRYEIISEQNVLIKGKIKCHSTKTYKAFKLFCN